MTNRTITLPSGIMINPDDENAKNGTRYAIRKGLHNAQVWLATHPDGMKEYVLTIGENAEFSSQSYEAIGAHIDMLAARE